MKVYCAKCNSDIKGLFFKFFVEQLGQLWKQNNITEINCPKHNHITHTNEGLVLNLICKPKNPIISTVKNLVVRQRFGTQKC